MYEVLTVLASFLPSFLLRWSPLIPSVPRLVTSYQRASQIRFASLLHLLLLEPSGSPITTTKQIFPTSRITRHLYIILGLNPPLPAQLGAGSLGADNRHRRKCSSEQHNGNLGDDIRASLTKTVFFICRCSYRYREMLWKGKAKLPSIMGTCTVRYPSWLYGKVS